MEVSNQLHALASLPPGKEKNPLYPLDRMLGGPQGRSGHGGEDKNSQPLPGIEPPIIQPVAQRYTAELPWFLRSVITTATETDVSCSLGRSNNYQCNTSSDVTC
jgi:hypothetical protein